MPKMMKIRLNHSACGAVPKNRLTVKGLGFRHLYEERLVVDTEATRGMVKKVCHLVSIVEEGIKKP